MSDNLLEKVYDKMQELVEDVNDLKVISAKQQINLELHMKRSDMLEAEVKILENHLERRFEPIEEHIKSVGRWLRVGGVAITLASSTATIVELIRLFK